MFFSCPVQSFRRYGRVCARVDVPLTVIGSAGEVDQPFRFDTGCEITMVSEDVAAALGLPAGGTPVAITGSTGTATGRLVPVTFRFPPDALSGLPAADVSSVWIVTAARTQLCLLGLQDVHDLYTFWTDDTDVYFNSR